MHGKWINLVLASMLLAQFSGSAGGTGDIYGSGKSNANIPLFGAPTGQLPFGDEDKEKSEGQKEQERKKQAMDKKLDDAIRKAWEKDSKGF